ncbi:MAG TPA: TIGR03016 family PEP-CTERM system-associated outer membrane protein [Burkholderiaceae bacterium]|nr:TIGR03016 family PEP-CTERM system-associated outer membrane protein [Burkholderiaceae bacterium]
MAAVTARRNQTHGITARLATAAAASLALASPVWAQRVETEPWITARLTASDNSGLGFATAGRDLITDITTGLRVRAEGARVSLIGSAALQSFVYANHTQGNDIIPLVDLTGRWAVAERFFFIEGAARTTQTHVDPFAPGLTDASTDNNATITQYRLSPYIESQPGANLHFRARSDNTTIKDYGHAAAAFDAVDSSYFGFHTISLERDPVPLGWRVEAERSKTQYQGEFVPLITDIGRALVNVAVIDTLRVGLRGGAERSNFLTDQGWSAIYGGQLSWHPSERTALDFDAEHRFFGNGVHLAFTHRMPWLSWDLHASRDLDTTPRSIFDLGPTDNVSALLDSILTTRIPNPAERANQVQNIISRQGLPASTTTVIPILAPRLSVVENVSLGVAYLGVRNTLALTLAATRTRDALEEGPLATDSPVTNNFQKAVTLAYTLRMTPTTTAGLTVSYSRIDSLDTATIPETTKDGSVRAHMAVQLAPKTTALFGAQQRKLASNVTPSGHETSVFAVLDHRF